MRRREFITLLGGAAAAWPLAARAQQPAMRRIGFSRRIADAISRPACRHSARACRRWARSRAGTSRSSIAGPRTRSIDCRRWRPNWFAGGPPSSSRPASTPVVAAKAATTTMPIVFSGPGDPVGAGLVDSLARPGGNVTGINSSAIELGGEMAGATEGARARSDARGRLGDPANPSMRQFTRHSGGCAGDRSGSSHQHLREPRDRRGVATFARERPTRCSSAGDAFFSQSARAISPWRRDSDSHV